MLKPRLIPVLLLKNGRMVKGINFKDYRDVGDPVYASKIYNSQSADELIFLDIEASVEGRHALFDVIDRVAQECFMPLTVGGGIRSIEDIRMLLSRGADKVSINTAAIENPDLIRKAAEIFGNQCLVISIDTHLENGNYVIYTHSGQHRSNISLIEHVQRMEQLGAGEILINSIDEDGKMNGYDKDLLRLVQKNTSLPVIASGGAGTYLHLIEAISEIGVSAVACASLFHFKDYNPIRIRSHLKNKGIDVKNV